MAARHPEMLDMRRESGRDGSNTVDEHGAESAEELEN
jgi:hypothetical protein